jgi:hypothetical protein
MASRRSIATSTNTSHYSAHVAAAEHVVKRHQHCEPIVMPKVLRVILVRARGAALRDFAAETLKSNRTARSETIWLFDPGPTAGTA